MGKKLKPSAGYLQTQTRDYSETTRPTSGETDGLEITPLWALQIALTRKIGFSINKISRTNNSINAISTFSLHQVISTLNGAL